MKFGKFFLSIVFLHCFALAACAQQQAVTNTGETVILHENGTWEYLEKVNKNGDILVNAASFNKSPGAVFEVKSKRTGYTVFIDPSKWQFEKRTGDNINEGEYAFTTKNGAAYALMITEKVELTYELLKRASLKNASRVATDAKIIEEEFRTVNGHKVLMLKLTGTIDGLKFHYFGYYITGESGTIQLISFTPSKQFEEQKKEMEKFLNGLSISKDPSIPPTKS